MTQQTIKAIETVYNGYRFRSRLEARWAVFFDVLDVRYEYEKEGYNLGDGLRYLPDFWLPQPGCWIEIKPDVPTHNEYEKARMLMQLSGRACYIVVGTPWPDEYYIQTFDYDTSDDALDPDAFTVGGVFEFQDCRRCNGIGLEGLPAFGYEGFVSSWICSCDPEKWKGNCGREFSHKVNAAYNAARTARFEHGEKPSKAPILR